MYIYNSNVSIRNAIKDIYYAHIKHIDMYNSIIYIQNWISPLIALWLFIIS